MIGAHCTRKRRRSQLAIEVLNGKSHFPVKVEINRCVHCASKGQRKRSTWGCAMCNVTLCVGCFDPFQVERNLTKQQIKMARVKFERVFRKKQILQGSLSFQDWKKCLWMHCVFIDITVSVTEYRTDCFLKRAGCCESTALQSK